LESDRKVSLLFSSRCPLQSTPEGVAERWPPQSTPEGETWFQLLTPLTSPDGAMATLTPAAGAILSLDPDTAIIQESKCATTQFSQMRTGSRQ